MTVAVSTASKIRDDILPATLVGKASGKRAPHVRLQFCIRQGEKSAIARRGGGGGVGRVELYHKLGQIRSRNTLIGQIGRPPNEPTTASGPGGRWGSVVFGWRALRLRTSPCALRPPPQAPPRVVFVFI
jgi:hypothetical protein